MNYYGRQCECEYYSINQIKHLTEKLESAQLRNDCEFLCLSHYKDQKVHILFGISFTSRVVRITTSFLIALMPTRKFSDEWIKLTSSCSVHLMKETFKSTTTNGSGGVCMEGALWIVQSCCHELISLRDLFLSGFWLYWVRWICGGRGRASASGVIKGKLSGSRV